MEYVAHVLLAMGFAALLAPHGDRLREMWRSSLLSSQLTIFIAPRQATTHTRKPRTVGPGEGAEVELGKQ